MNHYPKYTPAPAARHSSARSPARAPKALPNTLMRSGLSPWDGYKRAPAEGQAALRAASLYGDRFEQPDGNILFLVTLRAAQRIQAMLGLPFEQIQSDLQGTYVLARKSGAVVDSGRRVRLANATRG